MNTLRMHRSRMLAASMLGVTLIELMAVVMVIGILGMIAMPSYRQYVMRAQRAEAKTALLQLQTNQERFYLQNRTYGTDRAAHRGQPVVGRRQVGARHLHAHASLPAPTPRRYTATATPVAGGARRHDRRRAMHDVLDHGTRRAHAPRAPTAANCW